MKNAIVVQTIENRLLAISTRVNTVKVGLEVKKVSIKKYRETLEEAINDLFKILQDSKITVMERVAVETMLVQYNALEEKATKKIRWKMAVQTGVGLLTLGAFTFVQL